MQVSTNSNIYLGGNLYGKNPLNFSIYIHFKFVLPSRSALILFYPVWIPSTPLFMAGDHLSPTALSVTHHGFDFKRQSKLL